jgi:hypothetical protein
MTWDEKKYIKQQEDSYKLKWVVGCINKYGDHVDLVVTDQWPDNDYEVFEYFCMPKEMAKYITDIHNMKVTKVLTDMDEDTAEFVLKNIEPFICKWIVKDCFDGKDCWCKVIETEHGEELFPYGVIGKELADYIADLNNNLGQYVRDCKTP